MLMSSAPLVDMMKRLKLEHHHPKVAEYDTRAVRPVHGAESSIARRLEPTGLCKSQDWLVETTIGDTFRKWLVRLQQH